MIALLHAETVALLGIDIKIPCNDRISYASSAPRR